MLSSRKTEWHVSVPPLPLQRTWMNTNTSCAPKFGLYLIVIHIRYQFCIYIYDGTNNKLVRSAFDFFGVPEEEVDRMLQAATKKLS